MQKTNRQIIVHLTQHTNNLLKGDVDCLQGLFAKIKTYLPKNFVQL